MVKQSYVEIPLLPKLISLVAIHADCMTALGLIVKCIMVRLVILRLVQGHITNGVINFDYVNTKFNVADSFAKAMSRDSIEQVSIAIGLCQ